MVEQRAKARRSTILERTRRVEEERTMTCTECGSILEPGQLACSGCGDLPEEATFLRWVWIGIIPAAALHFILGRFGIEGSGFLRETFMTLSLVVLPGYGVTKIVQKLRDPSRPVLDEAVSVFSDRFGRVLLIVLVVVAAWYVVPAVYLTAAGFKFRPSTPEPLWFTRYVQLRWLVMCFVSVFGLFAILRQGPQFFNPYVRSTYERRRVRLNRTKQQ